MGKQEEYDLDIVFEAQNKQSKRPIKLRHASKTIAYEEGLSRSYSSDQDIYIHGDTVYIYGAKKC